MRHTIVFHTSAVLLLAVAPGLAAVPPDTKPSLPIFFILNAGHTGSALRYTAQIGDLHAGFAGDFAVFQSQGTEIRLRYAGANSADGIEGVDALPGRANFLIGNDPDAWHTGVP